MGLAGFAGTYLSFEVPLAGQGFIVVDHNDLAAVVQIVEERPEMVLDGQIVQPGKTRE